MNPPAKTSPDNLESPSTVRAMTRADLRRVAEIHVAAWRSAYAGVLSAERLTALSVEEREDLWQSTLFERAGRTNFVLESNGIVHGWCAAGRSRNDDDDPRATGELYGIHVHPDSHRRGVGTTLLAHVIHYFRERAFHELTLWVAEGNATARQFYEHRRFEVDPSGRKVTAWLGIPEVRYRRNL